MPSLGGGMLGVAKVGFVGDTKQLDTSIATAKQGVTSFGAAAESSLSSSERRFASTGQSISSMASKLITATSVVGGFMAAWVGYQAISGVVGELGRVVTVSRDLSETQSKFGQVFSGNLGVAEKWAAELSRSYGLSRQGAMGALSDLTVLATGMGLPAESAGELSSRFIKLAVDLGSFHNLDTVQVLDAIRSAMVGEYDPIQRFAGAISAATVEAKTMEMGLASTASEISASDKILALYELTLNANKMAVGDFARTSDGLANQQRILRANIEDVRGSIGTGLSPAIAGVVKIANDWITKQKELQDQGLPNFIDQVKTVFEHLGNAILANRDNLVSLANNAVPGVITALGGVVETLRFFENGWLGVKLAGQVTFQALVEGLSAVVNGLDYVMTPMNLLYDGLIKMGAVNANPFESLVLSVNNFRDAVALTTTNVIQDIDRTNQKYDGWRSALDNIKSKIGEIPPAHGAMTAAINADTDSVIGNYASMGSAMVGETEKYAGDVHVKFQNGAIGPILASINDIGSGWTGSQWDIVATTGTTAGAAAEKWRASLETPIVDSMDIIKTNWDTTTAGMLNSFSDMVDKSTSKWGDFASGGDSMGGGSYTVPDDWYYDYTFDRWVKKPRVKTPATSGKGNESAAGAYAAPAKQSAGAESSSGSSSGKNITINLTFSPSYMTGDKIAAQNVARELYAEIKKLTGRWA